MAWSEHIHIHLHSDAESQKKLDIINSKLDQLLQDKIDKEIVAKAASDLNTTKNELQKSVDENKLQ